MFSKKGLTNNIHPSLQNSDRSVMICSISHDKRYKKGKEVWQIFDRFFLFQKNMSIFAAQYSAKTVT